MKNLILLIIGVVTLSFALTSFTPFEPPIPADNCIIDVSGGSPWVCQVNDGGWTCNGTEFTTCDCTITSGSCSPQECDTENPDCELGGGTPIETKPKP
ncbi:MAG: hypothetical protein U9N86_13480 [Bacteroidota bacterium]|nr:hypothetical protein [Bacteroidota bacterium]